jgi:hypothetical protein
MNMVLVVGTNWDILPFLPDHVLLSPFHTL